MLLAVVNLFLVLVSAVIANGEGRLNHAQLGEKSLPWLNHGGMYADLICITALCYFASPYVRVWTGYQIALYAAIGIFISGVAHIFYYYAQPIPGHIIDPRFTGLARLPWGGWYHALYFAWALTTILLFFLATPGAPRLGACIAMTLFVPLAIWQPGWYNAKIFAGTGVIDAAGWIQAIVIWFIIWGVGYTRP